MLVCAASMPVTGDYDPDGFAHYMNPYRCQALYSPMLYCFFLNLQLALLGYAFMMGMFLLCWTFRLSARNYCRTLLCGVHRQPLAPCRLSGW